MGILFGTRVTAVGPEVKDLLDGGVLILYEAGAPPELAEISVLHTVVSPPSVESPVAGATLSIGPFQTEITAVGELAWRKVAEIGHVVVNFNGSVSLHRPGELCAAPVQSDALMAALVPGASIVVSTAT